MRSHQHFELSQSTTLASIIEIKCLPVKPFDGCPTFSRLETELALTSLDIYLNDLLSRHGTSVSDVDRDLKLTRRTDGRISKVGVLKYIP